MGTRVATVIIEPRLLVREALELLMGNHSYHVVCGAGSLADAGGSPSVVEAPGLVILGAQSADSAVDGAARARKLWPDSKIILLFDSASLSDFDKIATSQIDGCVPLSASPGTLIGALDLIVVGHVRVMVLGATGQPPGFIAPREEAGRHGGTAASSSLGIDSEGRGPAAVAPEQPARGTNAATANGSGRADLETGLPRLPRLSERETQILDGLVKGHANKVIARMCDITEATVKVHMKSILRKIQVGNRTQAAIWAIEHGYPCNDFKGRAARSSAWPHNGAS